MEKTKCCVLYLTQPIELTHLCSYRLFLCMFHVLSVCQERVNIMFIIQRYEAQSGVESVGLKQMTGGHPMVMPFVG